MSNINFTILSTGKHHRFRELGGQIVISLSIVSYDHEQIRLGAMGQRAVTEGKNMSAFDRNRIAHCASSVFKLTVKDRLAMIDIAYTRGNRAACAQFIEDLYAHFDAAEID